MQSEFSFKELYDVMITAPYDINIGDRLIKTGEIIALFDKLIISNFNEIQSIIKAQGGYNNATLISWQYTKELNFNFSQGIFNKEQFALLNNSKLIDYYNNPIYIKQREKLVLDNEGNATLKYVPFSSSTLFVYEDGIRIDFETEPLIQNKKIFLNLTPNEEVTIDYIFDYNINNNKHITNIQIGNKLVDGILCLEGKTKIQEDLSGLPKTVLIKIPRFKLLSNFSIRLGEQSQPVVGTIQGIAMPTGERGKERVMELIFLEDDIDSDM